ncbi:MAG: DUF418 domain-containing protein [Sphingomonas sp.]|uniref:DUF418 domain-containing protein n=1 Tax=Sphingomonas sp. TaxID=28214 RepID=UPI0025F3CD43|nr:DUF418 domain-containing protein [Sphingomonas sp.]MBX3563794.1 DUF418 domain-containing protein [Sphingomonas sp.]
MAEERLQLVDVLRGFALMALFLVHMLESYELYWAAPQPGIADTIFLLFMGKSFSLLALCFGFSFFVLMDRAARRGEDFSGRFAWRLAVLLVIGFFHALVYRGDIIQLLAGLGFVLLLAHRIRSNRVLIALAAFCFAGPILILQIVAASSGAAWANQPPHFFSDSAMPIYLNGTLAETLKANLWEGQLPKWWFMLESGRLVQIIGLYLVGMVLGRIGFFARAGDYVRARWIAFAIAAAVALALHFERDALTGWFAAQGHGEAAGRWFGLLLGSWFELAGTTLWALILIALWQGPLRALIAPFAGVGRLTLTLYIAQSLVFVPIFYGFGLGLWDDWSQPTRLWVGLAAIFAQLVLAAIWLRHFHYGPVEWGWRALTYLRRDIPFRH